MGQFGALSREINLSRSVKAYQTDFNGEIMKLQLSLVERNSSPTQPPNYEKSFKALENVGLSKPELVEFDHSGKLVSFNEENFLHLKKNTKSKQISFFLSPEQEVELSFGIESFGNTLNFTADAESYSALKDLGFIKLTQEFADSLPKFHHGVVDVSAYWRESFHEGLPAPVPGFGRLGWLHVLRPEAFSQFLKKEDLLNAPAHEVLEWNDGTIQIMTYKDFLPYDRPEALEAIRRLSLYLNEKRLDGPRMVPELAPFSN
jgi:hypothetical protein